MSNNTITYRYSVQMSIVRGYATPAGWGTRSRLGHTVPAALAGKPTDAKLAQYVADYNASLEAGGCNSHIGASGACVAAAITDHNTGAVVARYQAGGRS
jgi:hypothetical protein